MKNGGEFESRRIKFVPGSGLNTLEFNGLRGVRAAYGILLHGSSVNVSNEGVPVLSGRPLQTNKEAAEKLNSLLPKRGEVLHLGLGDVYYLYGTEDMTLYVHGYPLALDFSLPATLNGNQFSIKAKGDGLKVEK